MPMFDVDLNKDSDATENFSMFTFLVSVCGPKDAELLEAPIDGFVSSLKCSEFLASFLGHCILHNCRASPTFISFVGKVVFVGS